MSQSSSPFSKQNELIRSLRRQLEATERELADQKWLLQRFLESPSWRLTYPVRWIARQLRAVRNWALGRRPEPEISVDAVPVREDPADGASHEVFADLKQFFTELYRVQLQSFLTSTATLQFPESTDPEISVLLVLFNRAELTLACLRSLAENYAHKFEVIIVDNNSSDHTSRLLDRLRGARIIRNNENRHFLLAANQAAREARGEVLLLLNSDAQLLPGSLSAALSTLRSKVDIGAVGGRLVLLDGTLQEAGSIMWKDGSCLGYGRGDDPFAPMYMFRRDVDYCSGAFLLTPRRTWEELGGFDERYRPAYYEETDYCARLWERGLRVIYEPEAVVLHYEFASSGSSSAATDLQRQHQRTFAVRHQTALQTHFEPDLNSVLTARMRGSREHRVLFIDDRVPHAWLGSGFPRARAILLALLEQDCFVTFYPLSEFNEPWSSVYADMPRELECMIGYGPQMLEPFLRNRARYYDRIFISRPHNMKIVRPTLESHPAWFDNAVVLYDAEAIFANREITLRQLSGAMISTEEEQGLVKDEVEIASAADCVIAVSPRDAEQFRRHGLETVRVIGHCLTATTTSRSFQDRSGFLFVGAIHEEASPNGDSVIWFLEEIAPKIRKELGTDVPITLVGLNRSERVRNLAAGTATLTGHLADLTDLYEAARVFIAPTRYAAGIPHKVHEAAARGLPVVATPLLATQLGWNEGDPLLTAADAATFAEKCVQLYCNRTLWEQLRQAGLRRIEQECSPKAFNAAVEACLQTTKSRVFADALRDRS